MRRLWCIEVAIPSSPEGGVVAGLDDGIGRGTAPPLPP